MDREGSDFYGAIKSLKCRLGVECLPLQMPLIVDERTVGCIDLLTLDVHLWPLSSDSSSSSNEVEVIPLSKYGNVNNIFNSVLKQRKILLEQLSDHDDEFCEEMLELMDVIDDVDQDFVNDIDPPNPWSKLSIAGSRVLLVALSTAKM